jgi:hypothetical protein
MKLIHCKSCHDVVRLIPEEWRKCYCGDVGGQYNEDLMTATVGGDCDVIGIPNPFFDEVYKYLLDDNGGKQWYRKKHGWGTQDIWYGGLKGDKQIYRIESSKGPRLKIKFKSLNNGYAEIIILDKREYIIDGEKPKTLIVEHSGISSFKKKK